MGCEECDDPNSILRTKGSWFLVSQDIWTLTLSSEVAPEDIRHYSLEFHSRGEATHWYKKALLVLGGEADFSEQFHASWPFDEWPHKITGIEEVFRTRILKEKIYMKEPGSPSFEEQIPQ